MPPSSASRSPATRLLVNGRSSAVTAAADTPLLWVLRDELGLTGTKYGCGTGLCGACTVLIDGEAKRSCGIALGSVGAKKVTTIEGLSATATHPVQKAWVDANVAGCGYCHAGQILAAVSLLAKTPAPGDTEIDAAMAGNLCPCATYPRIRSAIHAAAAAARKP